MPLIGHCRKRSLFFLSTTRPVQGRSNVEGLIRGFSATWTETTWDVLTIMSSGNVVIAERLDRTRAGDKSVDLPVVGVFEMEGGKIKVYGAITSIRAPTCAP
jgi:limonene-1,2-epoxide hydrolase